jgi:hypothetical protein
MTLSTVEVTTSNLSIPVGEQLLGGVAAYERYLEATGSDGFEVTPNHSRFVGRVLERADILRDTAVHSPPGSIAALEERELAFALGGHDITPDWGYEDDFFRQSIRSGHSSFRQDTDDNGLAARFFPRWPQSLRQLKDIQSVAGKLSVVLYPGFHGGQVVYDDDNAPFAGRSFQPTARDWTNLGLTEGSSIVDIRARMNERGFSSITLDVGPHLAGFEDPEGLSERLADAGLVERIHLSVGRTDVATRGSEVAKATIAAKRAFIKSAQAAGDTPEGRILQRTVRAWRAAGHVGQIVLEDPPVKNPLNALRAKANQRKIIEHARELAAAA